MADDQYSPRGWEVTLYHQHELPFIWRSKKGDLRAAMDEACDAACKKFPKTQRRSWTPKFGRRIT